MILSETEFMIIYLLCIYICDLSIILSIIRRRRRTRCRVTMEAKYERVFFASRILIISWINS